MPSLEVAVAAFLAGPRIAVVGVSRGKNAVGNAVYRKMKSAGHQVIAINPQADTIEGDPCYPDLRSVPGGVNSVFIATRPEVALSVVQECEALHIGRVWMHRAFGPGSVSEEAVRFGREHGMQVIAGACPMMYVRPVDFFHGCMRGFMGFFHRLPVVD